MQRILGEESACHGMDGGHLGSLPKPWVICLNNRTTLAHTRSPTLIAAVIIFSECQIMQRILPWLPAYLLPELWR